MASPSISPWRTLARVLVLPAAVGVALWATRPASGAVLELSEAIRLALRNNPTIGSAEGATQAANARVGTARVGLLPKIQFSRSATRSFSFTNAPVTSVDGGVTRVEASAYTTLETSNFALSQLLYDFERTANGVRAAKQVARATKYGEYARRAQTIQDTHVAYTTVNLSAHLVEIAREATKIRKELYDQVASLFQAGLRPKFDVARAQLDYKSALIAELTAEGDLAKSRFALNTAIGLPELSVRNLRDDLDDPVRVPRADTLVAEALRRRPEVLASQATVSAAEFNLRIAEAGLLPRIDSTGSYAHNDGTAGFGDGWSLGIAASVPVFDALQTHYDIRAAKGVLFSAREDLRGEQNAVIQEVRERIIDVEESRGRIEEAQGLYAQAVENLSLARDRYTAGIGRIIDVTDAQVNLTGASQALVRAKADLQVATARLKRAVHLYPPEWFPYRDRREPAPPPVAQVPTLPASLAAPTGDSVRALGLQLEGSQTVLPLPERVAPDAVRPANRAAPVPRPYRAPKLEHPAARPTSEPIDND